MGNALNNGGNFGGIFVALPPSITGGIMAIPELRNGGRGPTPRNMAWPRRRILRTGRTRRGHTWPTLSARQAMRGIPSDPRRTRDKLRN